MIRTLLLLLVPAALIGCGTTSERVSAPAAPGTAEVETNVEGYREMRAVPADAPGQHDQFDTAWLKVQRETDLRKGSYRDLQVVVERRGFETPLYFRCENLPPGVRLVGTPRIDADGDRTILTLVAVKNARPVVQVFRILAIAPDGSIQGTRLVRLTVRN